ncbi:Hypothetical predicted protein [Olea europaea subsp. europaea]|uniref:Uncharacterized protein n=1 Tax=Olea europaea subsp. europaea TaxID=158383 RepID=A0A8S0SIF9_OLEEU|nr:Hypothetical predicted protein [Olea europaea subsp. europaea]
MPEINFNSLRLRQSDFVAARCLNMDIDDECEYIGETPATSISGRNITNLPPLPPSCLGKRKHNKKTLDVWDHFTIMGDPKDEDVKCECKYCGQSMPTGLRNMELVL